MQDYSQAEITIEETLANGPNYFQYIVSYSSEGLKIRALLTVPFGETPATGWPVVIFNHGFIPPDIYNTTERYVAYVAGFATNGYIVLRSDYRGHDQSEGEASGAYGSPDYTIDVLNAVGAMKNYPEADPNRIGMWGHSMGGYITLRSMVTDPAIKAGVIWAGVVGPYPNIFDRTEFQIDATPSAEGRGRWRLDLLDLFGYPEENPELWASISANNYLAELSGPVQLHHGTADDSVPYSVSELLYRQLMEAGQETAEFYGYEGDDHNLSVAFSLVMQRSIQFFDRYVKNIEE
jgi:dipeptidyl aminopeptidase/acylaminoacyl peptidase